MNCADPTEHRAHGGCDGNVRLTIDRLTSERNNAWAEIENLRSRLAAIEGHVAKYEDAIHAEIDEGAYYVETGHSCSCCPQEYNYADPGEFLVAIQKRLNT